jgi:hypothetical protein
MKQKWFFILAAFLTAASITHAQFVRGYGIKLGTVAANQSWKYTNTPELTTSARWGVTGGVYIELLDLPLISVVGEIQYTQKGMKLSTPITTESHPEGIGQFLTESPRVDYLSVPILAKVRLPFPAISPYLIAGPRADLLLSKKGDGFDPVVDNFKSTEVGGTFGLGVELHTLLPVGLLAEIRYNPNFRDAYKSEFLSVRNHSFDFLVGLQL